MSRPGSVRAHAHDKAFVAFKVGVHEYAAGDNQWGVRQMIGNVWEWCHDWFEEYTDEPQTDPFGPQAGTARVGRGGFWFGIAPYLRAADRDFDSPNSSGNYMGFRIAITAR